MIADWLHRQGLYRVIFLSLTEHEPELFFTLDEGISRFRLGNAWINPGPGYLKVVPRLRKFLKSQDVDAIVDVDIVLDSLPVSASDGLKTKVVSWSHFNFEFEQSVLYYTLAKANDYGMLSMISAAMISAIAPAFCLLSFSWKTARPISVITMIVPTLYTG